ncbi:MAG: lipid-A-disaccharide synthase [Candidatus Brocadiales bacterium]
MADKKIFISAGDPSGDIHGANLMAEISKRDPGVRFYGLGRHRMHDAGLQCMHAMDDHAIMWASALVKIPTLWQLYRDCKRFFEEERPHLAVLIDYAGFNIYLARAASKRGVPVIYYVCPQLWAHGSWRIKKLGRVVKKMLLVYPFEEEFYADLGVPFRYVGHPLFDELAKREQDNALVNRLRAEKGECIISILPGSREQEIAKLLPIFLRAAEDLQKKLPQANFIISCHHARNADLIEIITSKFDFPGEIVIGNLPEVIEASTVCLTSSGTVTLEVAAHLTPMVVAYRITPFAYFVAKPYIETPFLCLANKVAEEHLVPELLMYRDGHRWVADRVLELVLDKDRKSSVIEGLARVKATMGGTGASMRAAEEVLNMINSGV